MALMGLVVMRPDEPQQRTLWTQFTQQRLKAWQLAFTPRCVILTYMVCGIVSFAVGLRLLLLSRSAVEHVTDYTDLSVDPVTRVGSFEIKVTEHMEPPIWIYYELEGFHQNHRRYVKSRDDEQLQDAKRTQLANCKPWVAEGSGRAFYPCGLVARSVFNDSYVVVVNQTATSGEVLQVDSRPKTIAWAADLEGRFRNADPEEQDEGHQMTLQEALNMWILHRFPLVACEPTQILQGQEYVPAVVATRNISSARVPDCENYKHGTPSCRFVRKTTESEPFKCSGSFKEVIKQGDWGIESGHFIVWMRIAGLPNFRKLWGRVDRALPAGTSLKVYFEDNFPVREFRGRKAFVIGTTTVLGGRNDFLGVGYMTVGTFCLIYGLIFAWRHVAGVNRPLGDVTRLWRVER